MLMMSPSKIAYTYLQWFVLDIKLSNKCKFCTVLMLPPCIIQKNDFNRSCISLVSPHKILGPYFQWCYNSHLRSSHSCHVVIIDVNKLKRTKM